ncbi:alpha/beta hydrolase family protein [Pseudoduganella sp. R-34]|uniref:alpha/beta hydrolase family protein n=1 Tax=Pseudoduganella sp. R-34 TaxID=3404062 RepID=UPI003CE7BA14
MKFKQLLLALPLACLMHLASDAMAQPSPESALVQARAGFTTKIIRQGEKFPALPAPPAGVFERVHYKSPAGALAAYVTPKPDGNGKYPAIIWIAGGDSSSLEEMWKPRPRENDQSAAAYRKPGLVLMLPSLRGGNDNPGRREGFYGEVDDVIAAADYLASLPYVDPQRIYLGGHSTGATLVMLVAESTKRFRGVFAFGPVAAAHYYGEDYNYYDIKDMQEAKRRAPILWMDSVRSPLFVLEGAVGGNVQDLQEMRQKNKNKAIRFMEVANKSHFSILAPANDMIAAKIVSAARSGGEVDISPADISELSQRR